MRFSKSWIIATKDFSMFRKKKNLVYSTVIFPLFVGIGLPLVIRFAGANSGGIPADVLPPLLNAFAFFFIIGAALLPTAIASYSFVGDKVEKSLEPLLATPTTDKEILLGKTIAPLLLPVGAIYVGAMIFMALIDRLTFNTLGYFYFPDGNIAVILLALVPLASLLSVELNIIISARSNDVRSAQQIGGLMVLPFGAIYVMAEINIIPLNVTNLLLISGVLLIFDVILFFLSSATFKREEILTRWK